MLGILGGGLVYEKAASQTLCHDLSVPFHFVIYKCRREIFAFAQDDEGRNGREWFKFYVKFL